MRLSMALRDQLEAALAGLEEDPEIKSVVLTGGPSSSAQGSTCRK